MTPPFWGVSDTSQSFDTNSYAYDGNRNLYNLTAMADALPVADNFYRFCRENGFSGPSQPSDFQEGRPQSPSSESSSSLSSTPSVPGEAMNNGPPYYCPHPACTNKQGGRDGWHAPYLLR